MENNDDQSLDNMDKSVSFLSDKENEDNSSFVKIDKPDGQESTLNKNVKKASKTPPDYYGLSDDKEGSDF